MRRSDAPSMRRNRKIYNTINSETDNYVSSTSNGSDSKVVTAGKIFGSSNNGNPLDGKRLFRIVWRDLTTKKHKTWKGDGVLEATRERAVLKDDAGKYMASLTRFNINELCEDLEMRVGDKEIQLLDEIKTTEEFWAQHRIQMHNRAWGEDGKIEANEEEEKKPKGTFIFRPILNLDQPQIAPPVKRTKTDVSEIRTTTKKTFATDGQSQQYPEVTYSRAQPKFANWFKHASVAVKNELLCFLQPSELQEFLLRICSDWYAEHKQLIDNKLEQQNLSKICQQICDHPTLLQQNTAIDVQLMCKLTEHLPDWSELGPYDSAKFEFIQNQINQWVLEQHDKCIIVADDALTLDILKGYCHYAGINCLTLDENTCKSNYGKLIKCFNVPIVEDITTPMIAFIQSSLSFTSLEITLAKYVIFYNFVPKSSLIDFINSEGSVYIYYLITAGCYEEFKLHCKLWSEIAYEVDTEQLLTVNLNSDTCLTHELLNCDCNGIESLAEQNNKSNFEDLLQWVHFKPTFNADYIEKMCISRNIQNLNFIFSRSNYGSKSLETI